MKWPPCPLKYTVILQFCEVLRPRLHTLAILYSPILHFAISSLALACPWTLFAMARAHLAQAVSYLLFSRCRISSNSTNSFPRPSTRTPVLPVFPPAPFQPVLSRLPP